VLVLYDIDGTLLKSQHAGVHAMLAAFHQLHPDRRFSFDGVDIAGRLDTLIYDEMTSRHGVPGDPQSHDVFRHTYTGHLERRLAERNTVIARIRFCNWLRSSCIATTSPVGLCVIRTAESVVFTPWPPGPLAR